MTEWKPKDDGPDDETEDDLDAAMGDLSEVQQEFAEKFAPVFERAMGAALHGYLPQFFTPEFMVAYTYFTSWESMLLAAMNERERIREGGEVDGRRHTSYILKIRELERAGEIEEAERILTTCCGIEEKITSRPPLFFFHERLAMLYEKQKRLTEAIAVTERYLHMVDPTGGELNERMGKRLKRLRKRRDRHNPDDT